MNTKAVGQYIQYLRKQKGFSQKALAEYLSVSFQAVSKWENGDNLPDAAILLELADILDTTTDKILSGGNVVVRRKKKINIQDLREGIEALEKIKLCFGERSVIYLGAIEGINSKIRIQIQDCLSNEDGKEMLLAELVIQYLADGCYVENEDIEEHFQSEMLKRKIRKYMSDFSLFSNKAQNYIDYRPSYPMGVADLIFDKMDKPVIVDIGSGTGKLSKLCVERCETLYAVEPNRQMRQFAEELLSHHINYVSLAASAENTTLADASVDIITAAESYHWFDNEIAKKEFKRILKPNGYVFLIWNVFAGDAYEEEMNAISDFYRSKKQIGRAKIPHEQRAIALFGKNSYEKAELDNSMLQDFDSFCGGWLSTSFAPDKGTDDYKKFCEKAKMLFDKYAIDGKICSTIKTVCYWGKLK